MVYAVDLAGVSSPADFHQRVRAALPVPGWYGNNLDALHDILTEQCGWSVQFFHAEELRAAKPQYAASLERLCRECGAEILY